MSRLTRVEVARSIIDEDTRINAGGLNPIEKYSYRVDGEMFCFSSKAWGEFKTRTQPRACKHSIVGTRITKSKWDIEKAIEQYVGETDKEYRARTGRKEKVMKKKQSKEEINSQIDKFLMAAW